MTDVPPKVGIEVDRIESTNCTGCGIAIDVSAFKPFATVQCPKCEARQTVPARLGQFLLLRLIGAGGMGGVYHAIDQSLGRAVAIKVMLKSLGDNPEFMETFKREAQAAARLNHPNIAQIYAYDQVRGQPYIVMELVSGGSLARLMDQGKALEQSLVMRVGLEIAEGLQAADEAGLIHGDIKPENILFDEKGTAKLVDFGLASFANQASPDGVWGTPYYIAPEKIRRQKADARSDIYSLGAALFHALAGQPPFEGRTPVEVIQARLNAPAPTLSDVVPQIDAKVSDVIGRMLESKPSKRYPTYASLISDLRKALDGLPGAARKTRVTKRLRNKKIVAKKRTSQLVESDAGEGETTGLPTTTKVRIAKTGANGDSTLAEFRQPLGVSPEEIARRQKKARTVAVIVVSMIALIILAIGAAYGLQRYKQVQEQKRRAFQLRKDQESGETLAGEIGDTCTNVLKLAREGRSVASQVVANVKGILADASKRGTPNDAQKADYAEVRKLNDDILALSRELERRELYVPKVLEVRGVYVGKLKELTDPAGSGKWLDLLKDTKGKVEKVATESRDYKIAAYGLKTKVETLHEKIKADWKKRQEELEDAQRAKEAQERQRREAEALDARRKQELQMAKKAEDNLAVARDQYAYGEIVSDLKAQMGEYRTDEGKAALQVLIDRYTLLADLLDSVVAKLKAQPYKWGWIQDRAQSDVLGADPGGVMIVGRKVPWKDVSLAQMLRFIEYVLTDRSAPLSKRAERQLAAAVFCYEHSSKGKDDKGVQRARELAKQAGSMNPRMKDDIERLIPAE